MLRIVPVGLRFALRLRMLLLWRMIRNEGPTLPNLITLSRLAAALAMFACVAEPVTVFSLALYAWVSDGVDGWLAKRYGWCTHLGARLDQWVDWLYGFALLFAVYTVEPATTINLGVAFSIALYLVLRMRYWLDETTGIAKTKTFVQFFGGVTILAAHASELHSVRIAGEVILVCSIPLMFWSLVSYHRQERETARP